MNVNAEGYVSLSEARVVSALITGRSKLDPSFYPEQTAASPTETSGIPRFNDAVICTYADLDRLISECGLSKSEMYTIRMLMRGYTVMDIAEMNGIKHPTVSVWFRRAVQKICKQNVSRWDSTYLSTEN